MSIYLRVCSLALVLGFCCSPRVFALEGQSTFSAPAKAKDARPVQDGKSLQKVQSSYNDCTAQATAAVKAGRLRIESLPAEFGRCTDRFPVAGLYQECKKNLLKSAKGKEVSIEGLNRCNAILTAANFNPVDPVPIFITTGQAFFAGVGMNRSVKYSELQIPNYDCSNLKSAYGNIAQNAQHILFGNHPKMFLQGAQQVKFLNSLTNIVAGTLKMAKYVDVAGFGRLFGDPRTNQSIVYFPSGSCEFEATYGQIFAGINLFYLADIRNRFVTPYFAIAYYRQGQKNITTPELVAEVSRRLGPDFKAYSKDASTVFISSTPFKEVDKERDPRNICELPRPHRFVAVVHTVKGSPNKPEYLLLANIRNLCDYGDLQAKSLAGE